MVANKQEREKEEKYLPEDNCKHNNSKDNSKNYKETAGSVARILLISAGTAQLDIGASSVLGDILDIFADDIQLPSLFRNDVRNISEELVQLSDALFNVPDLCLTLDDQGLLEVHLTLVGHTVLLFQ